MAYCGFSDSSSDEDIDINKKEEKEEKEEDDWIDSKPEPIIKTPQQQNTKPPTQANHTFNSYLADQSLHDIAHQIGAKKPKPMPLPHAPPPLQNLTDSSTFNYNKGKYKKKKKRRKSLDQPEKIPPSAHPWHQSPIITGVSGQVCVGTTLDKPPFFQPAKIKLSHVIHSLKNVVYRPEEFVAIRMRLKNPEITVTIFSNGKLTTQGGKSRYSCTLALRKVARMFQQLDEYKLLINNITEPQFYGIQCNAHLGEKVDLQQMSEAFPNKVEYSTDIESSYLKFRDPLKYGDKGSCHVYHSGRVTILGCHAVDKCIKWIEQMYVNCKPHFFDPVNEMSVDKGRNIEFKNMFGVGDGNDDKDDGDEDDEGDGLFAPPPLL